MCWGGGRTGGGESARRLELVFLKMHSAGSRFVTGPEDVFRLQACRCARLNPETLHAGVVKGLKGEGGGGEGGMFCVFSTSKQVPNVPCACRVAINFSLFCVAVVRVFCFVLFVCFSRLLAFALASLCRHVLCPVHQTMQCSWRTPRNEMNT